MKIDSLPAEPNCVTWFIAVVGMKSAISSSVVICNTFNFYTRVKSDLCITLSVVHCCIFVCTVTFLVRFILSYTFVLLVGILSTSRTPYSASYSGNELFQVFVSLEKSFTHIYL